jgi:hypothetical protein
MAENLLYAVRDIIQHGVKNILLGEGLFLPLPLTPSPNSYIESSH